MANTTKKVNILQDLRKMDTKELINKIAELRKELVEQHRANKAGELPSVAAIAKTRKGIAKALTVLAEKNRAEAQEQEK